MPSDLFQWGHRMWGYGGVVRWKVEVARWRAIQAAKGASGAASETRATERHPSKQPHVHPDDSAILRATRFVYTNPRHPLRDEVLVEENRPRGCPSQRSVCESEHRRVPRQTTQCARASPSGVAMSSETKRRLFGESSACCPAHAERPRRPPRNLAAGAQKQTPLRPTPASGTRRRRPERTEITTPARAMVD